MVKIELLGLEFFAYHGVYSSERKEGNKFIVNLTVIGDFHKAVESDDIVDTINYESLYEVVNKEMSIASNLLEHVAGRILDSVAHEHENIKEITVSVEKLTPPINGNCKATKVSLTRKI